MGRHAFDLTGKRFGRLVAQQRDRSVVTTVAWQCVCDCGTRCVVRGVALRAGRTTSCGCLARERRSATEATKAKLDRPPKHPNVVDLTGQDFGDFSVVGRAGTDRWGQAMWRCRCRACGAERTVRGMALRSGNGTKCSTCNPRRDDVTGERFHKLTAVRYVGTNRTGMSVWLCRCDCGRKTNVLLGALRSGGTKSCGCLRGPVTDEGMRYGRLFVVERAPDHVTPKGHKFIRWRCRCDCGRETVVFGVGLQQGSVRSCGCLRRERVSALRRDLTGQHFGRLLVEREAEQRGRLRYWSCRCDCGATILVRGTSLTTGNTKSCGCLRDEQVKAASEALVGLRCGKLTVIALDEQNPKRGAYWLCTCECGSRTSIRGDRLRSGRARSCGCLRAGRATSSAAHASVAGEQMSLSFAS